MSEEIPTPVASTLQTDVIVSELSLEDAPSTPRAEDIDVVAEPEVVAEPVVEVVAEPVVEVVAEPVVEVVAEPVAEPVVEVVAEPVVEVVAEVVAAPITFSQPTFQINLFAAMNAKRN